KIAKGTWTDTVMGLKLGRNYNFRSRQIRSDGSAQSNWSGTIYTTAYYPLSNLYRSGQYSNIITSPINKITQAYYPETQIWFDVLPDFSSPNAIKTSRANSSTPVYIPLYTNHDTFYMRSKVVDKDDSLPWKTIQIITDFKPTISINSSNPCNDSSIYYISIYYNMSSTFQNNNCISYIEYNNKIDSNINRFYTKSIGITDNSPLRIRTNFQYSEGTVSNSFTDTTFVLDPLNISKPLNYSFQTIPNSIISFIPQSCNTGIELEHHTDTNYNSLISVQYKNNKTLGTLLQFNTNWDVFSGTALRYRILRAGIKGQWIKIPNGSYTPNIVYSSQIGIDTSYSNWTITRTNPYTGKNLEIELDISNQFNTSKIKRYLIKDSVNFKLESLFGKNNFVRCRLVSGTYKSQWSNTVSKHFSTGSLQSAYTIFTHPNWSYSLGIAQDYAGAEIQFGHSPTELNIQYNKLKTSIPDTFDYVDGDTVYFRIRRFTPIDTSNWSGLLKAVYKGSNSLCFTPKILHNGVGNNLDTFHLKWLDKNPNYSEGFQLMFGPKINEFKGFLDIPKGTNSIAINRKQYPSNWLFGLYPKCSITKSYSSLLPEWYALDGRNTAIEDNKWEAPLIYFNQELNAFTNNSEFDYTIQLYDQVGRLIFEGEILAFQNLTVGDLAQGIYHLSVINSLQTKTNYSVYIQ
ncbi:MAG: T9SS type A sorting domain-containing protein, partial [Bacteroidia bacterium]|nr:T9SS type A sorting domain-containing protein [Bacteroidia bacterium]